MDLSTFRNTRAGKWIAVWLVWTLFALFFTSQFALQSEFLGKPVPFFQVLMWQLVSGYVWFALSPLIVYLARRFPFEKGSWKVAIPFHIVTGLVVALFQQGIDALILPRLGYPPGAAFATFWEAYKFFVSFNLHLSLQIYWAVVGVWSAYNYYRKYRERELQTSKLEARLAQSRLQVLKMQLHPHFLFNALNAISELIHRDPDAADRMLTDLSDLLRMSFENLEVQEVSLKQELEFLHKYIEIEQMRFHDRLVVEMQIAPETLDATVPNMILQPIVENAIKHGISPRASGGRIDIETTRKNGHLEIKVQDNGLGIPFGDTDHLSEGVGLSNTRRRLKHLYGEKHKFSITPTGGQGVVVGLEIPFRNYQGIKAS